jgi:hypothetical protein
LIKYAALQRWPALANTHRFEMVCGNEHQWQYRGQVIPTNQKVTVQAVITRVEEGRNRRFSLTAGCMSMAFVSIKWSISV